MPSLTWPGKQLAAPKSTTLVQDEIVFPHGRGYPDAQPSGRLILGDNLAVMAALLPEYEGRIHLIYADPPFFTNRKYSARIGRGEDSRRPEGWALAEGYPDYWPNLDAYLDFLYQRLALMHRLLAPNGTLYLHLDWHANSYARLLLDEIFGADHLLNEIIWTYHGPSPIRRAFNRKHDTHPGVREGQRLHIQRGCRARALQSRHGPNLQGLPQGGLRQGPRPGREAKYRKTGGISRSWRGCTTSARAIRRRSPRALLERIILASSNPGDLVADFFCGSGTTAAVSQRGLGGGSSPRTVPFVRCIRPAAAVLCALRAAFTRGRARGIASCCPMAASRQSNAYNARPGGIKVSCDAGAWITGRWTRPGMARSSGARRRLCARSGAAILIAEMRNQNRTQVCASGWSPSKGECFSRS